MQEFTLQSTGLESVPQASSLIASAFSEDPTTVFILSSLTPKQATEFRPKLFSSVLSSTLLQGSLLISDTNWECCGLLQPPGVEVGHWTTIWESRLAGMLWGMKGGGIWRLFRDVIPAEEACKAKHLSSTPEYFYLSLMGTIPSGRGKGLCSAVMRKLQEEAAKAGRPIYLEAATDYCWKLYERLGFETLEAFWVGKGKCGRDGHLREGGEGILLRAMIWRPE